MRTGGAGFGATDDHRLATDRPPVVDFMGPADANDQRPIGRQAVVIRSAEPCAPCSHAFDAPYVCHLRTRACIAHMPVAAVVQAVEAILASRNSVAEHRQ
jgi:ADP-heptose:LPS heptosyltransferase